MKKYIPFCFLFTLFGVACKKSGNSTVSTTPNFYLATVQRIENTDTENYRIMYNAQNQVDTIIQPYGLLAFTYSANSYNVLKVGVDSDGYTVGYTVKLNASGNITDINDSHNELSVAYDSKGRISAESEYSGGYYSNTIYDWVNGDIDSSSQDNLFVGRFTYYYDIAHTWQPGDLFGIEDFLQYGRPVVRSTHLLTQTRSASGVNTYKYTFDSKSRIAQTTGTGNFGSVMYKYTYTAN